MRIVSLSTSWVNGGAALAAKQINEGLAIGNVCGVIEVSQEAIVSRHRFKWIGGIVRIYLVLRRKVGRLLSVLDTDGTIVYRSYSVLPSGIPDQIKRHNPDIVHLHWVQGEFLSVEEIGNIKGPIVWTLHDAWAISEGAAHHEHEDITNTGNMEKSSYGVLTKWMAWRKRRSWSKLDLTIVSPSKWMHEKAINNPLCIGKRFRVIPNAIDLNCFRPRGVYESRQKLGLPENLQLILVGSMASRKDPIKGVDLLLEALLQLDTDNRVAIVALGNISLDIQLPMSVIRLPLKSSRLDMSYIYSAVDITCVPSRVETHSMMAAESICCHTPVIAFRVAGNPSIIEDGRTGYLIDPFNTNEYAKAIDMGLQRVRDNSFVDASFAKSKQKWDRLSVARQYQDLYREVIQD